MIQIIQHPAARGHLSALSGVSSSSLKEYLHRIDKAMHETTDVVGVASFQGKIAAMHALRWATFNLGWLKAMPAMYPGGADIFGSENDAWRLAEAYERDLVYWRGALGDGGIPLPAYSAMYEERAGWTTKAVIYGKKALGVAAVAGIVYVGYQVVQRPKGGGW